MNRYGGYYGGYTRPEPKKSVTQRRQAEYAKSREDYWRGEKHKATKEWKQALIDEAGDSIGKCQCNTCPTCGKEKS